MLEPSFTSRELCIARVVISLSQCHTQPQAEPGAAATSVSTWEKGASLELHLLLDVFLVLLRYMFHVAPEQTQAGKTLSSATS